MRVDWIKKDGKRDLLVIALGWGASKEVIANQVYDDSYDVVTFCDYKQFDVDVQQVIAGYENLYLFSWSFGVWASEQLFANVNFVRAIAAGGTPRPIDRKYGIDPRVFDLTLKGIMTEGVAQFVIRMSGKHLKKYLNNFSVRSLQDCQEELSILNKVGRVEYTPTIKWSEMLGLELDLIFPARSIKNYCLDFNIKYTLVKGLPHYMFTEEDFIKCRIKG